MNVQVVYFIYENLPRKLCSEICLSVNTWLLIDIHYWKFLYKSFPVKHLKTKNNEFSFRTINL